MAYKIRPGIVRVHICESDLLIATRPLWEICPRIRRIPRLWAACWAIMELDPAVKTDADVISTFSTLFSLPEKNNHGKDIQKNLSISFRHWLKKVILFTMRVHNPRMGSAYI